MYRAAIKPSLYKEVYPGGGRAGLALYRKKGVGLD